MRLRFRTRHATPPCGYYEYRLGDAVVTDRTMMGICQKVREVRARQGLATVGDGFSYVMEYMCPFLPDGFCTQPSTVKAYSIQVVRAKTSRMFSLACVPADKIEKRMEICVSCPSHTTRGFCLDCTGLLDWVYAGFRGRRGRLPADRATGVCGEEAVLSAALATVTGQPLQEGAAYPANCWRVQETTDGTAS
jgi:hypothetical protein